MKTHTNNFKNEIKEFGRELDSIITYTINSETIELGNEDLNSITPRYESSILKSVMKQLDLESRVEIPIGTILNYQFGVKVRNDNVEDYRDNYDYINFGNYVVKEVAEQKDTESYLIKCCDKMLYSMVDYESLGVTYPITIRDYINALCQHLGLTFKNANQTFANYDREIQKELFLDEDGDPLQYTFRDVLDQLAEVTASTICINEDDDELEIRYINDTNDTINEEYLKDINVAFGKKYGPINSIVLSRSAESDNVYLRDEESVTENGLCEIKIKENQFMNFNDRSDYLEDILEQLDGLEYYINDYSSTGICYYNVCDKYNVTIGETNYSCIMFNDDIMITQGLAENVFTNIPKESETDYKKADKTDRKINQTTLIVDKQEQKITAVITSVDELEGKSLEITESLDGIEANLEQFKTDVENDYATITQIENLEINTNEGIINKFNTIGGTNLIRNSALLFEDSGEPSGFEYWEGSLERARADTNGVVSETGTTILLKSNSAKQSIQLTPDTYTLSFKYKQLAVGSTITFKINETLIDFSDSPTDGEIEKTITLDSTNSNITIEFLSSTDDGYTIYDLMLNKGDTKSSYSQHANETTTSTVKIGKGISVESNSTNTVTKVDSDGFRVLNKNNHNDTLLRATDTGTYTKTLDCDGYANLNNLYIKEVEGQVWITSLI